MDKLDAIIFVKVLEQGFQILQNSSVPLIWDHVDEWDGGNFGPVLQYATGCQIWEWYTWCTSILMWCPVVCFTSPGASGSRMYDGWWSMHKGSTHCLLACAGFPFWNIEMWDKKEVFAGVLTAGRVAKVAFDKAGVPAQVLYHNHANFVSSHSRA